MTRDDTRFIRELDQRSLPKIDRPNRVRRLLALAPLTSTAVGLAHGLVPRSSSASDLAKPAGYPQQPIRLVSPFPPGGGNDLHTRLVANDLPAIVGQPVITENKAGAGGNIGTRLVAESRPDGYTLLTSQVSVMAVNPALYRSAGFDPLRDFIPITQINAAPLVIVVNAESALRTIDDVRELARKDPGNVTYATPGSGTLSHLAGVVLEKDGGIAIRHVPYRGAAPAMTDLIGGQVTMMITSTSSVSQQIQQGRLRALAVTSPRRIGVFEKVPTLEEAGLKGMTYDDWYGIFAPAGMPPDRVAYLNQAITRVLRTPEVSRRIVEAGGEVVAGTSEALAAQLKQDIDRWTRVVKLSGASVD